LPWPALPLPCFAVFALPLALPRRSARRFSHAVRCYPLPKPCKTTPSRCMARHHSATALLFHGRHCPALPFHRLAIQWPLPFDTNPLPCCTSPSNAISSPGSSMPFRIRTFHTVAMPMRYLAFHCLAYSITCLAMAIRGNSLRLQRTAHRGFPIQNHC
jgi:hypothetical protein